MWYLFVDTSNAEKNIVQALQNYYWTAPEQGRMCHNILKPRCCISFNFQYCCLKVWWRKNRNSSALANLKTSMGILVNLVHAVSPLVWLPLPQTYHTAAQFFACTMGWGGSFFLLSMNIIYILDWILICFLLLVWTGGRRKGVTLAHILWFTTGSDQEPLLGFKLHPTLLFTEVDNSFLPSANTCINAITLPTPSLNVSLPSDEKLFDLYDCAFLNGYFGNH